MDDPWIRIVSQTGLFAAFALYLLWAVKRGSRVWAPFVGAAVYAVLFEHWNMLRYAHVPGGYHYNVHSWVWIAGDVPLYIPLAWALILATSRSITDHLRLAPWARPFCDALLALLIDVSMDAVAIRLNFWYWHGVRFNQGFFGVPADNFLGWLLVSFTFSALTRILWEPSKVHSKSGVTSRVVLQLAGLPVLAYIVYLCLEAPVHIAYGLFHANSQHDQLLVLLGPIALFGIAAAVGLWRPSLVRSNQQNDESLQSVTVHAPRQIFHLFGLIGLLFVPVAIRTPGLWSLALGVWAVEATIMFAARRRAAAGSQERTSHCR